MSKEDTMTKELKEARARLEDAIDCSGAAREDDEIVAVEVADLRLLLSAPKVEVDPCGYAVEYDDGASAFVRFDPTTPEGWPLRAIFPPTCKGYKITTVYTRDAYGRRG
jgi:hypothetical protein